MWRRDPGGAVGAAPLTFGISLVATAVITAVVGLILAKPRAAAGVDWDGAAERFTLGDIVARHGGNWREARSLAEQAIAGLNGVLDTVGGRLLNGAEVETGSYGRYKREYVYRLTDSVDRRARDVVFRTDDAQELVDFGVFRSLSAFAAPVAEPCGARH